MVIIVYLHSSVFQYWLHFSTMTFGALQIVTYCPNSSYTTTPQPFYGPFWDHQGEPVPEENFWTSWYKGRLSEADTNHAAGSHSIRTNQCPPPPSPQFFTGRMPFLSPNQQCQSTEGLAHSSYRRLRNTICKLRLLLKQRSKSGQMPFPMPFPFTALILSAGQYM